MISFCIYTSEVSPQFIFARDIFPCCIYNLISSEDSSLSCGTALICEYR